MPRIENIPLELFLDNIFPILPLSDLLRLSATNKFFHALASDETFWHRKLQAEFNFSGSETARNAGWKFLYRRLSNPIIYVWGERKDGRLGRDVPRTVVDQGVPYPIPLRIPGARIVNLVAGGMSFHAVDSRGDIYVWGKLDGTASALVNDGFSEPAKQANRPLRLKLPVKFRSITCGRLHAAALDASSNVWTFTSWGRPIKLSSPLLDHSTSEATPVQIECGWSFTSILMQSGDVLVYWPFSGRMGAEITRVNEELSDPDSQPQDMLETAKAKPTIAEPDAIPCHWWLMHGIDPVKLPPIPTQLPVIAGTGLTEEKLSEETKLIKVAAMDNNVIGLTNKGHVLKYNRLQGEATYQQGQWEYLPHFSEVEKARETFVSTMEQIGEVKLEPPQQMLITHISAHYQTFIAYSTGSPSVVLIGKFTAAVDAADPHSERFVPRIIPELQYKSVISVVLGDYHYGALTSDGKLLTWGAYSHGALGLGDPIDIEPGEPGGFHNAAIKQTAIARRSIWHIQNMPEVRTPTEVRFDHVGKKRERYCFAATAAGWHMGALVIDLEPDEAREDAEDEVQSIPGSFPDDNGPGPSVLDGLPPSLPAQGLANFFPFRFGYAARGVHMRGRGGSGSSVRPRGG